METLKTAVIGTGNMGRHHVRVYSELDGSELVGVSDVNVEAAGELAKRYGTRAYKDYKEMMVKEKPDCVSVVVPTKLHHIIGCDVLKSCNALVEKPIAVDVTEAKKLISIARENKHVLMVGHIERFNPAVRYLKEYAKKSKYLSFNIMRLGPYIPKVRTTGVLMDMGIHDIDMVRYLTKEEPIDIRASCKRITITDYEDHAHVFMKMPSCTASLVSNWISPRKIRHMYVALDNAFIYLNYITQALEIYDKKADYDPMKEEGPVKVIEPKKEEPLKLELEEFLSAVREGREPLVTGDDALKSLQVALTAEKIGNGVKA